MQQDILMAILGDRPIAYHPIIARAVGSVNAGVFLSQLLYWQGKGRFGDWTYKTQKEFEIETGLSRTEQETARKMLGHLGIVEEDRRDVPAKLFYRVNIEKLQSVLVAFHNQDCGKPAIKSSGNPQTILTETTTETTTDISQSKERSEMPPSEALPFDDVLPAVSVPTKDKVVEKVKVSMKDNGKIAAPLTPAGVEYFKQWTRKKWATTEQRRAFEEVEAEVGSDVMIEAVKWAARKGIADIDSICTTAKKWGGGKKQASVIVAGSKSGAYV
jgi:hypothetical protein